jgi:hypothetical protein
MFESLRGILRADGAASNHRPGLFLSDERHVDVTDWRVLTCHQVTLRPATAGNRGQFRSATADRIFSAHAAHRERWRVDASLGDLKTNGVEAI